MWGVSLALPALGLPAADVSSAVVPPQPLSDASLLRFRNTFSSRHVTLIAGSATKDACYGLGCPVGFTVKVDESGCECVRTGSDPTTSNENKCHATCDEVTCPKGFKPAIDNACSQCTCNIMDVPKNTTITTHSPDDKSEVIEQHLLNTLKPNQPILYAVSTGSVYHDTRAKGVSSTWCAGIKMCAFYSDAENPSNNPPTIPIEMSGLENVLSGVHLAQIRYLRIYEHAANMILTNRAKLFAKTKWLVITDDDTYVFHHNMISYLSSLDTHKPIYTGHTIKDKYYPVSGDGDGHTLNVSITQHFACGGGGSVFSRAGLEKMAPVIGTCVSDSMPGGEWWGYQSDWMFGLCTHRAGVELLNQKPDRFGQFIYRPGDLSEVLPDDPGSKQFCVAKHGYCDSPVSLHPIHDPVGMYDLHNNWGSTKDESFQHKKVILLEDGHVDVLSKNTRQ